MRITPKSFLDDYITNPLAKELSCGQKLLATALSILLLPLAVFHIRSLILKKICKIQNCDPKVQKLAESVAKVSFRNLQQSKVPFRQAKVPEIINNHFVKKYYAKNVPAKEEVTVPYIDPKTGEKSWRKWHTLSRKEKIHVNNTGTREHNKLGLDTSDSKVDDWFFVGGQHAYLEGDPREHHGNDHCVRASIIASVFAYLYQKYDEKADMSHDDLIVAQLAAAGHDSGRQTEGPDVYDEKSAHNTKLELQSLGLTDVEHLEDVHAAIEHKDSDPLQIKRVVAKCVQCADSAEFARLTKRSEWAFNNSRKYLDIYKEFEARAQKLNPADVQAAKMKHEYTFADFCFELDTLRLEINSFISTTHTREFRENVTKSESGIYAGNVQAVNTKDHPLLHAVLTKVGIIPSRALR